MIQKTKEVTFEGVAVKVNSNYDPKKICVTVKDPNLHELLESIENTDLRAWLQENRSPDAIFGEPQLEQWAEDNGYIKK